MDTRSIIYKQGIPFYPVTFPPSEADGILIEDLHIQDLVDYINQNNIKSAYICNINSYEFLCKCKSLEHIVIELKTLPRYYSSLEKRRTKLVKKYAFDALYELDNLKSLSIIDIEEPYIISEFKIDLSRFPKLEEYSGMMKYVENLDKAGNLKTLYMDSYDKDTLEELSVLKRLDTLAIVSSKIRSLQGIEKLTSLQCLYLHYNRLLSDISTIKFLKKIKALRIENCGRIEEFSDLTQLQNLELLELSGSNELPSIGFISELKSLKTFIFSVNILDGNLEPCCKLEYAYCDRGRKNYNLKDKDLPKGKFVRGNEEIEEWRRLE